MKDKLLEQLLDWANSLKDIASEQLPDFANQIVMWQSYSYFFYFVILMIFSLISFWVFCLLMKDDESKYDGTCVWLLILTIFLSIGSGYNYCQYKKCEIAPKLVIIDCMRNL